MAPPRPAADYRARIRAPTGDPVALSPTRQLNPYELSAEIDRAGFKSEVHHAFRQFPLRLFNNVHFRPLNNRLFRMRSAFIIVAERT